MPRPRPARGLGRGAPAGCVRRRGAGRGGTPSRGRRRHRRPDDRFHVAEPRGDRGAVRAQSRARGLDPPEPSGGTHGRDPARFTSAVPQTESLLLLPPSLAIAGVQLVVIDRGRRRAAEKAGHGSPVLALRETGRYTSAGRSRAPLPGGTSALSPLPTPHGRDAAKASRTTSGLRWPERRRGRTGAHASASSRHRGRRPGRRTRARPEGDEQWLARTRRARRARRPGLRRRERWTGAKC